MRLKPHPPVVPSILRETAPQGVSAPSAFGGVGGELGSSGEDSRPSPFAATLALRHSSEGENMDERTDISAAFGLRLSADLLTALVVTEVFSADAAQKLIDDAYVAMRASHPEHEQSLRKIAAALTTQVALVAAGLKAQRDR